LELETASSTVFATFWSWNPSFNLQHFGGICIILELEAAVSTVFAALLSSNFSFLMEFPTFCC